MKKYHVMVGQVDDWRGKHLRHIYLDGMKAVRAFVPAKLHYSRNAGGFVGYEHTARGIVEYLVREC